MKKTYKKMIVLAGFYYLCAGAFAQEQQTDVFNYGDDQKSHSYATEGQVGGSKTGCGKDSYSIKVGNCDNGTGLVSVTLAVNPDADAIKISFLSPAGGPAVVTVDGVRRGTISGNDKCAPIDILILGASRISKDGQVTVVVSDTIPNCEGDITLANVTAYSNGTPTGINSNQQSTTNLVLSPNPAKGTINVNFTADKTTIANVVVLNLSGQVVYQENLNQFSGIYKQAIDLSEKANGLYFVKITTDTEVYTQKFTLQNNN